MPVGFRVGNPCRCLERNQVDGFSCQPRCLHGDVGSEPQGVNRSGVTVKLHKIGEFADFDGSHVVVTTQNERCVDGLCPECFVNGDGLFGAVDGAGL